MDFESFLRRKFYEEVHPNMTSFESAFKSWLFSLVPDKFILLGDEFGDEIAREIRAMMEER